MDTYNPCHILRERRMGREDARNTVERDWTLYLDDELEKQIKIEYLEVSLREELFEDHVLEDLLQQSFLRGGDNVKAEPDAESKSIMDGKRGPDMSTNRKDRMEKKVLKTTVKKREESCNH